ncbi:MAG: serine/threonine-protein kinase [Anaerolineales bacterium]
MRRITRALEEQPDESGKLGQLQPGVSLQDRYLVLELLATGGMGSVYKGRDLHFPNVTRLVAVKEVLNTTSDANVYKMMVANFEREANLLATLSHPAIPRIFDYFVHGIGAYLVMEFIDGINLERLVEITQGFLPQEKVIAWAVEICDVLSYLHGHKPQPIIFRDIKPANVMVDARQHIRLIDFGIARLFQPGDKGTMIGTEGYSPPEQYRGEASPAGDVYALGATLHHVLTRVDPRTEAPFSFAERPINAINPKVFPELEAVVNRALSYEPEDRYASAEDMKRALLSVAKKTGTLMREELGTPIGPQDGVEEVWSFECEDEVRGSPTIHNGILYMGCYDNNLYAHDAKTGEFRWKYATEGGIPTRPAINDNVVFIASEDHRLYAVTADTGKQVWTYLTEGPIRSSPVAHEGHLFFGCDDGYLHVVNILSGRRAWRTEAAGPIRSTPVIVDDRVLFGSETGHLYSTDFRGEMKWRFRAKRAITGSPIMVEGVIYVGSMDGTLYALMAEAGWEVWRFRLGKPTISTPAYSDGRIFTGCADGHIYAIDARSSQEVWRFKTEHQVTSSPIIHEDSLYCGSVDGSMYCLDVRSGRKRWQFRTMGPITGTPVISDDILYFGSTDHRIYALLT